MVAALLRVILRYDTDWILDLLEFITRIIEQRSKNYVPYQTWTWHKDYASSTRKDPVKKRVERELSMPYEWTPEYRAWLKNIYNNQCAYCGRTRCQFHIDHIIPVSWSNCPGGLVDNGVWACASCNTDRGNADLATWHLETFQDEAKTRKIVEKVWRVQTEARRRFGEDGSPERESMRKQGKKILMTRLRRYNKRKK